LSGLGQICNGQMHKDAIFIVAQLINAALTTVLIEWVLTPIESACGGRSASTKLLELRFIALLTEGGAERLEVARAYLSQGSLPLCTLVEARLACLTGQYLP